jgi:hypothetical protein
MSSERQGRQDDTLALDDDDSLMVGDISARNCQGQFSLRMF